jgi:hypothetical protein
MAIGFNIDVIVLLTSTSSPNGPDFDGSAAIDVVTFGTRDGPSRHARNRHSPDIQPNTPVNPSAALHSDMRGGRPQQQRPNQLAALHSHFSVIAPSIRQ